MSSIENRYKELKELRKITSFSQLPKFIQNDINDFIYYYKPKAIYLNGSYADGSWIDKLDCEMATIRKAMGKSVRISDCDVYVPSVKGVSKYKSLELSGPSIHNIRII